MSCSLILVGWLSLAMPAGFTATPVAIEDVAPVAGPPGMAPVRIWNTTVADADGHELNVTVFGGQPPYPGGPMVVAETATFAAADGEREAFRTSTFMGTEQEVVVTYPDQPDGDGTAMLVVRGAALAEALSLLAATLSPCPD